MHGKIMTIYQVDVDEKILLNQISPHTVLWRCWLDVTSVAWNSFVIINFINIRVPWMLHENIIKTCRQNKPVYWWGHAILYVNSTFNQPLYLIVIDNTLVTTEVQACQEVSKKIPSVLHETGQDPEA